MLGTKTNKLELGKLLSDESTCYTRMRIGVWIPRSHLKYWGCGGPPFILALEGGNDLLSKLASKAG